MRNDVDPGSARGAAAEHLWSSGAAARERLLTTPFLLCAAANFLQALAFNLYLHFPGFLQALGAGEVQIGIIFGLTAAAAIVARPPIGRLMDERGRRTAILAGGMLNVLVCALYLTVSRLGPWVYAVRLGHGVAEAILFTGFFTQAADLVPPARRTEGIALFGVSGMLPISLGGLLGDAILWSSDYRAVFLTSVGLASASLLLSLPLRDQPLLADGLPSRGFLPALLQRDLRPLWFIGTLFAIAIASYFAFLKTFVLLTGVGSVGRFFTTYAIAAISLRLFFAWLPDRAGPRRVLLAALTTLGLGLFVLARAEQDVEVLVAGTLCGLGHGFIFPILCALVVARTRPAERGVALSIFTALFDGGILVGGPLLGGVIRLAGYSAMFATAGSVIVAGTIAFAIWDRTTEQGGC